MPDPIDAVRVLLADDLDFAEAMGGREVRRNSRTDSDPPGKVCARRFRPAQLPHVAGDWPSKHTVVPTKDSMT